MWNIASALKRTVLVADLILQLDQSRIWGKLLKESQWQFTCQKLCWTWTWHQHKAAIHLIQLPRYSHLQSRGGRVSAIFILWFRAKGRGKVSASWLKLKFLKNSREHTVLCFCHWLWREYCLCCRGDDQKRDAFCLLSGCVHLCSSIDNPGLTHSLMRKN